jgi:hypothetical protein
MLGSIEKVQKPQTISISTLYDKLNDDLTALVRETDEKDKYMLIKHQLEELKKNRQRNIQQLKFVKQNILELAGMD